MGKSRDILTLSVPNEDLDDTWWLNNLVEHAIKKKISVPPELFDKIDSILQHEDSKYFLAELSHYPGGNLWEKFNETPSSLIPYDLPSRSNKEQTYVPRLGCSYSDESPDSSNRQWGSFFETKIHESTGH